MKGKVVVSFTMIMILIFSLFSPVSVYAEEKKPNITVESVTANAGDTIDVKININNNPGIIGAVIKITYDEGLDLLDAKSGNAFEKLQMTKPGEYTSPCQFLWDGMDNNLDVNSDGEILILTFKVSDEVQIGSDLNIKASYKDGDIIDASLDSVDIEIVNGKISVFNYIAGDVNGDGKVNTTDVVLVRRTIAGGYNVTINEDAGDVNADGRINASDVIFLRRYIAGGYTDANGEPLKLVAGKVTKNKCDHTMSAVEYKAPTCTEKGNIAYWYCDTCGKYFRDEFGLNEVSEENIQIEALGHTPVVDPVVPATATTPGLTEGSHCSVCGVVLVEQQPINSNAFEIKYNIANGDTYLSKIKIDNPNPTFIEEGKNLYLEDIETDGYQFLGWFDGAGDNAEQIKKITNADHSMTLYAHWKKIEYTVQFKSDLVPEDSITYTTKEGKVLPSPTLDGYTFVGWTDFDGNMYTQIKPGTKGDITLYANWISDRNKAWAKKKLDDPMVYDDGDVILFAYEIGEIRDVPIYEIENFGKINKDGVSQTVTKKYSVTTSEQLMNSYVKAVENATTKSSNWTLSSGWSDETEVSEEWCKQNNISREEAESRGKSDTGNWYVSNSQGGSSTTTVIDSTDTYNLNTTTNNTRSWSDDYAEKTSHGEDTTVSTKGSFGIENTHKEDHSSNWNVNGNVGFKAGSSGGVEGGISGGGGHEWGHSDENKSTGEFELGASTNKDGDDTTTMKGYVSDINTALQTGTVSNHTVNSSNTSTWNTESGYGASSTTSQSKTISSAVSEMISNSKGYGKSYIKTEDTSKSQGQSDYSSSADTYSSSVTYSKIASEEKEMTYTTTNTKTGFHRWVMAGTAHVFGIVGYDIASKSYFVYTYSVMDDEMHRFEDYSYLTSSFDDNQNGVIPFVIPTEIDSYVQSRIFASDGLEIDENGTITDYNGDDNYVIIPDYMPIDNLDGSINVIKVTGLSENAFRGNENITGIELSRFINQIPNNAFRGCKNLWKVDAFVTSVGDNAFKDCPLLSEWNISSAVTKLGSNAFDGAERFTVKAANKSVVKNAINSGAKDITIGLNVLTDSLDGSELLVPAGTKSVSFYAYGTAFKDLSIISNADKTVINRMNIESDGIMPLQVTSSEIDINQSKIKNTGICAAFTAKELTLDLYGASVMESGGPNALFCKDTNVVRTTSGLKTSLTLTGNLVTCGEISDPNQYIVFAEGSDSKIIKVDDDTFESMLKAYKLSFDANGGECDTKSKQVDNGTPVGELPIPTRVGYDFEGWYLDDGTEVTKDKVFSTGKDITVIAKWKVKEFKVNWNEATGLLVDVKRIESPYKNAETGNVDNGSTIYYGDVLKVTYDVESGYMMKENGVTDITVSKDVTFDDIYAVVGKLSDGWVLESEVPENATRLEEKWTYDKITNITSDVDSVEGYTLYDTTYVWSDYGNWSSWSNNKATASDSRAVETRNIAATYKTQYQYERCYGLSSAGYYVSYPWQSGACQTWEWTNWLDQPLPNEGLDSSINSAAYYYGRGYNADGVKVTERNGSRWDIPWWSQNTRRVQVTAAYTQYRYRDRSQIYTYYLTKTENLESDTEVEESEGIENIQKWVKYVVY